MNEPTKELSLLYVEDDAAIREGMEYFLRKRFETVFVAGNGHEGLDAFRRHAPDIVVTDITMPVMDGLTMMRRIQDIDSNVRMIVTTAYNEIGYLQESIDIGVSQYVLKPIEFEKFEQALFRCSAAVRARKHREELNGHIMAAYHTINTLIDCGEKSAQGHNTYLNGMDSSLDVMIDSLLRDGIENGQSGPETLVMTVGPAAGEKHGWFWYELSSSGEFCKCRYLDPPQLHLLSPEADHTLHFINVDSKMPDDALLHGFINHVTQRDDRPRNMVWYRNGACVVCAMNYPRRVTRCDASVIKSLAVQALYLENLSSQFRQTEEAFGYTINALARAAEVNDEDTGNHIIRVGEYCAAIARYLGYSSDSAASFSLQAQLHDVGKIHIPIDILRKPSTLTPDEMKIMQEHTLFGARIIGSHPRLEMARKIALAHHERWDGSGYPNRLNGADIPIEARILTIADTYDALRTRRSYKPAYDHATAVQIILEGDGRTMPQHFDPDLLRVFRALACCFDDIYENLMALPVRNPER